MTAKPAVASYPPSPPSFPHSIQSTNTSQRNSFLPAANNWVDHGLPRRERRRQRRPPPLLPLPLHSKFLNFLKLEFCRSSLIQIFFGVSAEEGFDGLPERKLLVQSDDVVGDRRIPVTGFRSPDSGQAAVRCVSGLLCASGLPFCLRLWFFLCCFGSVDLL